jgi:hypothetical protein
MIRRTKDIGHESREEDNEKGNDHHQRSWLSLFDRASSMCETNVYPFYREQEKQGESNCREEYPQCLQTSSGINQSNAENFER